MEVKGAHVRFFGKVQGVYFRAHTEREAKRIGIIGWVKNVSDGSVEAYFEGEGSRVQELITYCRTSIPMADVKLHHVDWILPAGEFTDFNIIH